MEQLRRYRNPKAPEPCEVVDDLYTLADRLKGIDALLARFWPHLGSREAAVQAELTDYDFLSRAKAVEAIADDWQSELDGETA